MNLSGLTLGHDLPVAYLKIDRGFTARMLDDERTAVIVASTIDMAHRLNLQVIAEGVETVEQGAWLDRHGCDQLQGYYFGKPMDADRFHRWLAEHPSDPTSNSDDPASETTARIPTQGPNSVTTKTISSDARSGG